MTAPPTGSKVTRTDADGNPEKRCSRCKEWWPADLEFFCPSKSHKTGLSNWCHACYCDWRREKRATNTARALS